MVVLGYLIVVALALATRRAWLEALAAFLLATLLLWPALRRRRWIAFVLWAIAATAVGGLGLAGQGDLAIDCIPVMVNVALCALFARTLSRGAEPLIARVIAVLESPARVALPRVAGYARALTSAWALLFGAQALLLAILVACAVPDGVLARFGIAPPIAITGTRWRWYLDFGSYATVLVFLIVEYAFRRWYLRHIPHVSLPVFIGRLARRWPALAHSVMHDTTQRGDA